MIGNGKIISRTAIDIAQGISLSRAVFADKKLCSNVSRKSAVRRWFFKNTIWRETEAYIIDKSNILARSLTAQTQDNIAAITGKLP